MNPADPILDQPLSLDADILDAAARTRLANQEIVFQVDGHTDLHDLTWPWADATYVRHVRVHISDPQHDELTPLVTRYFPGYQETIMGSEGMIIAKRLAAPLGHAASQDVDERAVIWILHCQAEGDRLLRLDVELDWGEPLTQRMVDGLLVAQRNPGQARGIYAQHNAESTRVFGNPYGRPTGLELRADGTARLSYYVLVNGEVEVPLVLTLSDVGEQVAWNSFLGLRDAERAFELSADAWEKAVKVGRLWTPDAALNRALQAGRLAARRGVQKLRSGLAPSDRAVEQIPALVKALDVADPVLSRNLLAHLRRVAERGQGKLPAALPSRPKDELTPPGSRLAWQNSAYLLALQDHLRRHPNPELLAEHYPALALCAEALVYVRINAQEQVDAPAFAAAGYGLRAAVALATQHKQLTDAVRWESEACELERITEAAGSPPPPALLSLRAWRGQVQWQTPPDRPWDFAAPSQGIALVGEVWDACGLQRRSGKLAVYPTRGNAWGWWAWLDVPVDGGSLSLLWDGATLFCTRPVSSDRPVRVVRRIRALKTDELDFDLTFEMTPRDEEGGVAARQTFRPAFDLSAPV